VATALAEAAARAIETLAEAGLVVAMNRHNGRAADSAAGA
jgi:phage terminase Nu1 subunit (DNA packaging protein)